MIFSAPLQLNRLYFGSCRSFIL